MCKFCPHLFITLGSKRRWSEIALISLSLWPVQLLAFENEEALGKRLQAVLVTKNICADKVLLVQVVKGSSSPTFLGLPLVVRCAA